MSGSLAKLWRQWRLLRKHAREVLGMNQRNLHCIYPHNPRRHFPLADDKLQTKNLLQTAGVPVPVTYRVYRYFYELSDLKTDLLKYNDFVIKPARGSGGGGIVVIAGREGDDWLGPGGRRYTLDELRKQISDIIFGVYSFDLSDAAVIEERVVQHAQMSILSPFGLADVRVILLQNQPVLAMSRIPTRASDGRANLHQGAVGVGIDLETGRSTHAILKNEPVQAHPDTGEMLVDRVIPHWPEIMDIAQRAAAAVPLKYLGVDVGVSDHGPVMIEINVRPGLQIQNANLVGLRGRMRALGLLAGAS